MTFLQVQEPERPDGRHPDDFYATPHGCTEAMLRSAAPMRDATDIVEPACGDGAILDVLTPWATPVQGKWSGYREGPSVAGIESDKGRAAEARRRGHAVLVGDFLTWTIPATLGARVWIVGNPPYSLAREFVEHSLGILPTGCRVTFLLRLAFLAAQSRAHLYSGVGFHHLGVLGKRPSFTPDGKTDSSDYAWFTWEVGYTGPAEVERL